MMEYYSAVKKKKNLLFATMWMDLENVMLNEVSQSEKDKNHVFTHVESNKQTELTRKIETDSQMQSRMTAGAVRLGVERLSKKEKELMDIDNSVVIAEEREV